jgi:hypothetical protein
MMHPATELRFLSREIGYGVFAVERIPTGTITWTGDPLDQRFTPEQVGQLPVSNAVRVLALEPDMRRQLRLILAILRCPRAR